MKLNKFSYLFIVIVFIFAINIVCAVDLNDTPVSSHENIALNQTDVDLNSYGSNSYYVDNDGGDDANDGKSWDSSVKTFSKALDLADDEDTVYLADGVYSGLDNTKITISIIFF